MTCSCPKCHAEIEIDLSSITEVGSFTSCPECKGRFWTSKESYARMALRKEGKTYCDKCYKEFDRSIVCAECGVMYPDYYLVQTSKPPRRQVEKPDLFSLSFTLKPAKQTSYSYTYTAAREPRQKGPGTLVKRVGITAMILLLLIGSGVYYHLERTKEQYAKNFMRALYGIKYGTDSSLNICAKISSDWKTSVDAGQKYTPQISSEDTTRLNNIKDTTDKFMQTLNKPPKKFIDSNQKLSNLYGTYIRTHSLAISPSGSLTSFTNSVNREQSNFDAAAKDLKVSLPKELSAELKIAQAKYRSLKDI